MAKNCIKGLVSCNKKKKNIVGGIASNFNPTNGSVTTSKF